MHADTLCIRSLSGAATGRRRRGSKMISLPNCVLNDSHRRDGHVYLLVGNYFSDALGALKPSAAYDKSQQVRAGITT